MYNEGSIPITNVVQSRLFDITFAKVSCYFRLFIYCAAKFTAIVILF